MCELFSRFMLDLKEEQHKQFIEKVSGMAKNVGCEVSLFHANIQLKI